MFSDTHSERKHTRISTHAENGAGNGEKRQAQTKEGLATSGMSLPTQPTSTRTC